MLISEAKKKSNAKWDSQNMKIVAAKVRKETAEEFSRLCRMNGDTPHSVIKACIEEYIKQNRPM